MQHSDMYFRFTYGDATTVEFKILEELNEIVKSRDNEGPVSQDDFYTLIDT